jgi:hypothetical protein
MVQWFKCSHVFFEVNLQVSGWMERKSAQQNSRCSRQAPHDLAQRHPPHPLIFIATAKEASFLFTPSISRGYQRKIEKASKTSKRTPGVSRYNQPREKRRLVLDGMALPALPVYSPYLVTSRYCSLLWDDDKRHICGKS